MLAVFLSVSTLRRDNLDVIRTLPTSIVADLLASPFVEADLSGVFFEAR